MYWLKRHQNAYLILNNCGVILHFLWVEHLYKCWILLYERFISSPVLFYSIIYLYKDRLVDIL